MSGAMHLDEPSSNQSGRSAAWLARYLGVVEVVGSNPAGPIFLAIRPNIREWMGESRESKKPESENWQFKRQEPNQGLQPTFSYLLGFLPQQVGTFGFRRGTPVWEP